MQMIKHNLGYHISPMFKKKDKKMVIDLYTHFEDYCSEKYYIIKMPVVFKQSYMQMVGVSDIVVSSFVIIKPKFLESLIKEISKRKTFDLTICENRETQEKSIDKYLEIYNMVYQIIEKNYVE